MQRWACLFIFRPVPDERRDELHAVIKESDVLWLFAQYRDATAALKPLKDALKGKTLVLFREMVVLSLVPERLAELKLFIDEVGSAAERIVIHYPRHRIVWDIDLERRFTVIRTGEIMPYVFVMDFATQRQLRFIHYQAYNKYLKGSDVVDKLRHLPHIVVGDGDGAIRVPFIEVLRLQAASELIVHPTRAVEFTAVAARQSHEKSR
jgi:hypothetical protein